MSYSLYIILIIILLLNSYKINCFVVLPFDTIFIKDKTITETNYFSKLTQLELYVNFTIGSKNETIKSVLKMDKSGFIIYEKAYNYSNSSTYEKIDITIDIRWIPKSMRFPSRDYINLPQYKSYKDFKKGQKSNAILTNKTEFLRVEDIFENDHYYYNDMFYEYGIIGLKILTNTFISELEFIKSIKIANITNSYWFHLYFDPTTKKGFSINNNKGYILLGEQLTDDEKEKEEIEYVKCVLLKYNKMAWGMEFSQISLKYNENNIEEITNITNKSEIIATFPYIKGVSKYFEYINKTFFDELIEKNICYVIDFHKHDLYTNIKSYGYACDSNSKLFMDNLNNKFPDLILYNHDINRNFTLTKNDLFAFNNFDDSDNNLYFLIVDGIDDEDRWILGIPFLKKYVISYDYDSKRIGFYKNYGKIVDIIEPDDGINFFSNIAFKIIIIIICAGIIFNLGMLFQRYLKSSRKKRANELDDDYEYEARKALTDDGKDENTNRSDSLGINDVQ